MEPVFRSHRARAERWLLLVDALLYQVADDAAPKLAAYILREAQTKKPSRSGQITLRFTRNQRALLGRAIDVVRRDRREGIHQ